MRVRLTPDASGRGPLDRVLSNLLDDAPEAVSAVVDERQLRVGNALRQEVPDRVREEGRRCAVLAEA
jgi:hypothetical protein